MINLRQDKLVVKYRIFIIDNDNNNNNNEIKYLTQNNIN